MEDSAKIYFENFIQNFIVFNKLLNGADPYLTMELPYPIFHDLLVQSTKEKERQVKMLKERADKMKLNQQNQNDGKRIGYTRNGNKLVKMNVTSQQI